MNDAMMIYKCKEFSLRIHHVRDLVATTVIGTYKVCRHKFRKMLRRSANPCIEDQCRWFEKFPGLQGRRVLD